MTKRLYHIVNLDTGAGYYFQAITPMDAMNGTWAVQNRIKK